MTHPKILLSLDTDPQPSVFDSVVAVDSGVEHLFRHGGVTPDVVRDLVYGAMFTRGPEELKNTAIFVGGSSVAAGEKLLAKVTECFFGPMRVSVMLDSNGSNTTAAAAVIAARRHIELQGATVAVLAGTGSVGKRVMRLLASEGATVRLGSRTMESAQQAIDEVVAEAPDAQITPFAPMDDAGLGMLLDGASVVVASGPPGVQLLATGMRNSFPDLKVAIDLNAVPPLGIEGIEVTDKRKEQQGCICYGAIGVGGTKMKIHRAAVAKLFTRSDLVLDALEIYEIGKELEG
jgi:hypothetical protein